MKRPAGPWRRLKPLDQVTDVLDPILVTGSSILLDDDVAPKIIEAAEVWLRQSGEGLNSKQPNMMVFGF